MDYTEHIAKAVEYIEQNLTNEIDLTACAKACGYSEYHFLRVFKEVSGLTPADYIRKKRLSEIAKRICQTDEYISGIVFMYGLYALFQTPDTTHADFVNTIHRAWEYINRVWLQQSSYKRRSSHEFECYKEQSRVFSERIYIPIEKK